MGRPAKQHSIDGAKVLLLSSIAKAQAAGREKPQDPFTLQMIVEALLQRVHRRSLAEEKMLRLYIQGLAGSELQFGNAAHRINSAGYLSLGHAPIPKGDHLQEVLQFQRNILLTYFKQYGFNERVEWVRDHLNPMMERIKYLPCLCPYKRTFTRTFGALSNQRQNVAKRSVAPLSSVVVITQLLSDLHNRAGVAQIQKLIKAAKAPSQIGAIYEKRRSRGLLGEYAVSVETTIGFDSTAARALSKQFPTRR